MAKQGSGCGHPERFRLFKRGPFPMRSFKTFGWWCPDCDELVERGWHPVPKRERGRIRMA